MRQLKEIKCMFCGGWGHKAKTCTTLKLLNLKTSDVPNMKIAWGSIKAEYISQ